MEENFKIPNLDSKIKFVPRKNEDKIKKLQDLKEDEVPESLENIKVKEQETSPKIKQTKTENIISKPGHIKCSYQEPHWSKKPTPDYVYNFEVLKNGTIVENYKNLQSKPYWLIGKLPDNNITMAHPTISRYHAVFQYRPAVINNPDETDKYGENDEATPEKSDIKNQIEKGWYLYDLNSTHGSFVNKIRIPSKTYVRIRVGYMIKFGASTRNFFLQGPEFDEEAESELSVTEIKEQRRKREEELLEKIKLDEKRKEDEGISWGMSEDADEETDLSINPFASTNNEELFLDDPKKTLRGYFEREGLDLDYKVDEMSLGTFVCRIELPVHDALGRPLVAEVCHKGKKKDCVVQAALEACRILDRHGVLRQANHEPRKRKIDHSDSDDDDDFYDRTGDVERKRKIKATSSQNSALSFDELLDQEKQLLDKLADIDVKINNYHSFEKKAKNKIINEDDLDDFMSKLSKEKTIDKIEIRKLRVEAQQIKIDHVNLQRLINIARPIDLPPLKLDDKIETDKKKKVMPLYGKRGTFKFTTVTTKRTATSENTKKEYKSDEEEMEEAEEPSSMNIIDVKEKSEPKLVPKMELEIAKDHSQNKSIENKITEQFDAKSKKVTLLTDSSKTIPSGSTVKNEDEEKEISLASKKRRSRIRVRGEKGRENVDIDDSEEIVDMEKYSTWVPPENQSGDGSTNLNDKYGY